MIDYISRMMRCVESGYRFILSGIESLKDRLIALFLGLFRKKQAPAFVTSADASQNAVDIFRPEWVGAFPPGAGVSAGSKILYKDDRLIWWDQQEPVSGKKVLELGPMEASHTWQLLNGGAASVAAIESNTRSYLKCLVAKEVLGLSRATFYCADFVEYMSRDAQSYDICLASGVLYHMKEPLRMLQLACQRARTVFLWTHYYDESVIRADICHRHRFLAAQELSWSGYKAMGYYRAYGAARRNIRHLGGSASYSFWLPKDDIIGALRVFGKSDIRICQDDPGHPHGPAITLFASSN